MKESFKFYFRYIAFWLVYFTIFKLVFVLYHFDKLNTTSFLDYLNIFINGSKLDFSITGYTMLLPTLVLIIYPYIKSKIVNFIFKTYTAVLVIVYSLLEIIDLELYNYWHFRLNKSLLDYIDTPKEMLANLMWYHFIILPVALILIHFLFNKFLYERLVKGIKEVYSNKWLYSLVYLFFIGLLIIPIRGGFSTSPINTGAVYFHKDIVVNHAAINPIWNFMYTITESEKLNFEVRFFDKKVEENLIKQDTPEKLKSKKILKTNKPNIVIVILESFTSGIVEASGGVKGVTPQLNRLIKEGVFFSDFYASGASSNKGIGAIISGYPALPNTCILHYEDKTMNLPGIAKSLKPLDYTCKFMYGGDIDFAHIKSFLITNQFDEIISSDDFPDELYYSKWGVPDHIVFDTLFSDCNVAKQPFLNVYFTLSSHEPFDVPMEDVFPGKSGKELFFNSAYYTDKSLGEFIDKAKQTEWWDSSLVVVVADHGARFEKIKMYSKAKFHIPMLWLGGALNVTDTVISTIGSQTDIAKTILNQMDLNTDAFTFGKDLLSPLEKSSIFYSFSNGIGYISDSLFLVYDLTGDYFMELEGNVTENDKNIVKARIQNLVDDFTSR